MHWWLVFLFLVSCTNLDLNEVENRVAENFDEGLNGQGDIDPAGDNDFSFSVYGDTHIGSQFGRITGDAIARSQALGHAFAIVAGDCTDTGRESEFSDLLDNFNSRNFLARFALGNHDIFFGGWRRFKAALGASIYTFNADNVGFFVVDSANGTLGQRQLAWLDSQLEQSTQPIKIVVSHFSPTVGEVTSPWRLGSEEEVAIIKDMNFRRGVDFFLAGHWHGYQDIRIGGTTYITTGGVNTINEPGHAKHFVEMTVSGTDVSFRRIGL